MPQQIKGSARKSKATGRKATASSTKARKATARGKLSTKVESPDTSQKGPEDKNQDNKRSKKTTGASDNFAKTKASSTDQQWQKGKKARRRAERNAEEKKAKREKKVREEAERAEARARTKAESDKPQAKPQTQAHARRPPPHPSHRPRTLSPKQRYDAWSSFCTAFFANPNASADYFPIPRDFKPCHAKGCIRGDKLGFCHHQLKALLMGSGELKLVWLKRERLRWHPDKFPGREEVSTLAQEMFQMLQRLIDGDRPRGGG
ncbi:hypothetical protein N431DRAFT_553721 [Stipitochalara longipes BDJ]|nr:hypothetical protein N431DRAFT_553721 [Stipitochalara longipes BDJ]